MATQNNLEGREAPRLSFSQEIPDLQIVYDTMGTELIKVCPRKYQLTMIEGWQPRGRNPHLDFGLATHSARETYDKVRAADGSHDDGVHAAVRRCLESVGRRAAASRCDDCGFTVEVLDEPLAYPACYHCNSENLTFLPSQFFPWRSDDKYKNLPNLLRTVVWYLDNYQDAPDETIILSDGSPAVEVWFRLELPLLAPDGQHYVLTGHIDRLLNLGGSNWFADLKTSKNTINTSFFDKFSPDNQISQYTLGGQVVFEEPLAGGIIDAAQVAVHFTAFQRALISRSPGQMEEWLKDIQIWIKRAEGHALDGYWPMNDTACHHFGGCPFRGVCNKDPKVRKNYLRKSFVQRSWDPMKPRE